MTLVTWFHADAAAHRGVYAQVHGDSSSRPHHEVYLRCVDVCVGSFRRWNPTGRCIVVVNDHAVPELSDVRTTLWKNLGVELHVVENRHRPDTDFSAMWQNQFFLFDVMSDALSSTRPGDTIAIVDSDVVVRGQLDGMAAEIAAAGRIRMIVPLEDEDPVNGSTRRELGTFLADFLGTADALVPAYLAGEFVAGEHSVMTELLRRCEAVYSWAVQQQGLGLRHPLEEAHIISIADPIDPDLIPDQRWVERIWTKVWTHRSVPPYVAEVPIWHLPAEKTTGIVRLHNAVVKPESWFWAATRQEWDRRVFRAVGVPRIDLRNALLDVWASRRRAVESVRKRVRSGSSGPVSG